MRPSTVRAACQILSGLTIGLSLPVTLFGCMGSLGPVERGGLFGAVMSIGGMLAFSAGLISLTLLACLSPSTRDDSKSPRVASRADDDDVDD
jgi:hypothetical protein